MPQLDAPPPTHPPHQEDVNTRLASNAGGDYEAACVGLYASVFMGDCKNGEAAVKAQYDSVGDFVDTVSCVPPPPDACPGFDPSFSPGR